MTARLATALVLALVAQPAFADEAQKRGGGSGGGGSREVGARHHSSPPQAQPRGGGDSGSRSSQPSLTDAQRRHPRAGTGTGHRGTGHGGSRGYYVRPYYGFGGYYRGYYPYYYPYDYYYGPYAYAPYGYGYGYGYGHRRYRESGSLRLLVNKSEARVYVDGYYAGIVDDFDGIFQRLHVAPGRHEITFKLEGYRTHKVKAYVPSDHTLKIHHDMEEGVSDSASEQVVGDPATAERTREGRYGYRDLDAGAVEDSEDISDRQPSGEEGRLVVDVRPGDASIYVDGEFRGTGRGRLRLRLPAGRHRLEVVHPGFRTIEREVEVNPGETTDIELELERS